jgi:hypothetical protein
MPARWRTRPARELHRDQQLLHRHRLREGRRGHPHAAPPRGGGGLRCRAHLYFDRHDGQACTIEDWLQVFQDATGRDLSQFKRWYTQAGTPKVTARWRDRRPRFRPDPHAGGPRHPRPAAEGARRHSRAPRALRPRRDGASATRPCTARRSRGDAALAAGRPRRPQCRAVIPSLLRGFSAPVLLDAPLTAADRLVLLAHDSDPFNRWEAGRSLMRETLTARLRDGNGPGPRALRRARPRGAGTTASIPPSARSPSRCRPRTTSPRPPSTRGLVPDPTAIHAARRTSRRRWPEALRPTLTALYDSLDPGPAYSPDADPGRRARPAQHLPRPPLPDRGPRPRPRPVRRRHQHDRPDRGLHHASGPRRPRHRGPLLRPVAATTASSWTSGSWPRSPMPRPRTPWPPPPASPSIRSSTGRTPTASAPSSAG